jgi:hypothetical protein
MQKMRARHRTKPDEIKRSACAAVLSILHDIDDLHSIEVIEDRTGRSDCHCADSESLLLATKKFLRSPPSRLNSARQGRISARTEYRRFGGRTRPRTLRIVHHRKQSMTNACIRNTASSAARNNSESKLRYRVLISGDR